MYWAKRFRDTRRDLVLKTLTAHDYALATGVEYASKEAALECLKTAQYDVIKACLRGEQLYYLQDGRLNILVIDYELTLKYISQMINTYSRLPHDLNVCLDILVFSETRQKQVMALRKRAGVTAILANWKY
jgi:hypothetical protein